MRSRYPFRVSRPSTGDSYRRPKHSRPPGVLLRVQIQHRPNECDCHRTLYDGTKLIGIEFLTGGSASRVMRVEKITNVTTDSGTAVSFTLTAGTAMNYSLPAPDTGGWFVRWRDDGSSIFADYSLDGSNWTQIFTESVGTFITPTAYGVGGLNETGTTNPPAHMVISLQGWLETNSATL